MDDFFNAVLKEIAKQDVLSQLWGHVEKPVKLEIRSPKHETAQHAVIIPVYVVGQDEQVALHITASGLELRMAKSLDDLAAYRVARAVHHIRKNAVA